MARWYEPTEEQEEAWKAWVAERPPHVRALAERFPPWNLYFLPSTPDAEGKVPAAGGETGNKGHRVTIRGFDEGKDGKVYARVAVNGEFNRILFNRDVFGIDPERLIECDLPPPDEIVGATLTEEQALANMDQLRSLLDHAKDTSCDDPACTVHAGLRTRVN